MLLASIDLDYPRIDVEFIPDAESDNANTVSLPRILMEKPIEDGNFRAIIWGNELKEAPTLKVEFC